MAAVVVVVSAWGDGMVVVVVVVVLTLGLLQEHSILNDLIASSRTHESSAATADCHAHYHSHHSHHCHDRHRCPIAVLLHSDRTVVDDLQKCVERFVERMLEFVVSQCVELVPTMATNKVISLCNLLEMLLTEDNGIPLKVHTLSSARSVVFARFCCRVFVLCAPCRGVRLGYEYMPFLKLP